METGLIRCILDMRTKGVRVDLDRADQNKKALQSQSKLLRGLLEKEAGMEVDIWASASIQKMFDKLKLEYPRTEKGAPSFTKNFLNDHPEKIAQILVKLREFDKADSTFIDSILRHEHNGIGDMSNVHAPSGGRRLTDQQRKLLLASLLQSNSMSMPGRAIGRARFLIGRDMNTAPFSLSGMLQSFRFASWEASQQPA